MNFQTKRFVFYTFSILLLIGQIRLGHFMFNLCHVGNQGFWMAWFLPIIVSFLIFIMVFFIGVIIPGKENIGWGDWHFTLPHYKSFKKVYHSELGYFILYVGKDHVKLFQQGWFRLTFLKQFSLEPEYLQKRIKEFLDEKYQEQLRKKKEEDIIKSKIKKIKDWDGFLDKQGKRDEKINQLLK